MLMLNRPWDTFANFVRRFVVLASVVLLFTGCVFAQTFTTLYSFDGSFGSNDGTLPAAALIRDADGNLYSTTARGGTGTDATVPGKPGTVFQLTKSGNSYTESVLYSFTGYSDGGVPQASLVMDAAGNLYGTTSGDSSSNGTVFELIKSGSSYTFTVLHSFTGGSDGSQPVAGLIMDAAGNLYGTAQYGGTGYGGGNGTVFELIKSGSSYTYTVLYSFNGGSDGATPTGTLVLDGAGDLYGTTLFGGDSGSNGTVFKLTNSGGSYTESLLHTFTGGSDGANPFAGLIMDAAGNLYGTTVSGGTLNNGTVFKLTNSGNSYTESVLYNFAGGTDGATPFAGVIMDTAGNLYGTTSNGGGSGNYGTVFQLTKSGNSYTETVLHRFTAGSDGANPQASVIMDAKGNLYGTAFLGGTGSGGTVFELTPSTPFSKFSAKLQVSSTGFQLQGSFTQGAGAPAFNPVIQALNLTIGTYNVTIPAGSFHRSKSTYVYEGTINGVALQFRLVQVSQTSWTIQAEGSGVNLSTLTNPVTVTLAIGNNTGTIQLKAQH